MQARPADGERQGESKLLWLGGAHTAVGFGFAVEEGVQLLIGAFGGERCIVQVVLPFVGQAIAGVLHLEVGQGWTLPDMAFEKLGAEPGTALLPTLLRLLIIEGLHGGAESLVRSLPVPGRPAKHDFDSVRPYPLLEQFEVWSEFVQVLLGFVVNR